MKKIIYSIFILSIGFVFFQFSKIEAPSEPLKINLKWYKSYPTESWEIVRKGMLWSFSYLGASLPKDSFDVSIRFSDSTTFEINLNKLGFNKKALENLTLICDTIKKSEDYRINNSIDLSRFFLLTLYSPYHYYKITGVEKHLNNFSSKYKLRKSNVFGITASSVSNEHRKIKFSKSSSLLATGFLAEEGHGSLINKTFIPHQFEVFDLMQNGQFRYAIYNKEGELTDNSNNQFSIAGKVGKCMWCHETYVQPLYRENIAVSDMLSNTEFTTCVSRFQNQYDNYRRMLNSEINFSNKSDHTASELLYISFMEPSLYRLSHEFKKDTNELKKMINEPTHVYDEFPFLGNLYYRKNIDSYFSYSKIKVAESVREKSEYEPNYFK